MTTSDRGFSDYILAFGAGYVEGHLTAHRIQQQITNYRYVCDRDIGEWDFESKKSFFVNIL